MKHRLKRNDVLAVTVCVTIIILSAWLVFQNCVISDINRLDAFSSEELPLVHHVFWYRHAVDIAFCVMLVSICLFLLYRKGSRSDFPAKIDTAISIALIIILGTIVRSILSIGCYGNYDMDSWKIISGIVERGGNVYAETSRYQTSPVWCNTLTGLRMAASGLNMPPHAVIKLYLTFIDLLTLLFLILIAKEEKLSIVKTALFFYLNPVSFLLTGYHGQIENLAILMVVAGIYFYMILKKRPFLRIAVIWFFSTFGMMVKHSIFYETIICVNYSVRRIWIKLLLLAVSAAAFLMLFVPYLDKGMDGIIKNVFCYSSFPGFYGVTSLILFDGLKYLFIISLFLFPFFIRTRDLVKQCLAGLLFFITFTTGGSVQYFVLPIALGALRPSKGFIAYTILASLFISGSYYNIQKTLFILFNWNVVWIGALYWIFSERKELGLTSA